MPRLDQFPKPNRKPALSIAFGPALLAVAWLLSLPAFAVAAPISISYTHEIESVDPALDAFLSVGDSGTGRFELETDSYFECPPTLCTNLVSGISSYLDFSAGPTSNRWTENRGPWNFEAGLGLPISIYDSTDFSTQYGGVVDGFGLFNTISDLGGATEFGPDIPGIGADESAVLAIVLATTDLSRVDGGSLFVPTNLDGFEIRSVSILAQNVNTAETRPIVGGLLTSYSVVPEPSAALLIGAGLAFLARRMRPS